QAVVERGADAGVGLRVAGDGVAIGADDVGGAVVEVNTLRLRGHAAYDTCDYLRPGEQDGFNAADPLPKLRAQLLQTGRTDAVTALETELKDFIETCIQISLNVARPDPASLADSVYAP